MKTNETDNFLSKEQRKKAINKIIDFFETERDEKIGVIAAEDLLEMFLQEIGFSLYDKGIEDSKEYINERQEDMLINLEALLKKRV